MNTSSHAIANHYFEQNNENEENILPQSIILHKADNAWKPSFCRTATLDKKEELRKSVQGILNKLTFEKFEILVAQLKRLKLNTEEELRLITELIYENALCQPLFSSLYANLCTQVALMRVRSGKAGQNVNLRKSLLTKCQIEFEAIVKVEKIFHQSFDEERKWRQRSVACVRFIGNLLKTGQLIAPIICECIEKLLVIQDETSLECVCQLCVTCGEVLDKRDSRSSLSSKLDKYFMQIQNIVNGCRTSTRIRFMLQDLIDLRENNWIPRRIIETPKCIDEIHQEIQDEAIYQYLDSMDVPFYDELMYNADRMCV